MTTTPTAPKAIVFVDLNHPPASVQLNVGDELVLLSATAAGASFISNVNVPANEFTLSANMFLMVPLALIRIPGQPGHTALVHHAIAHAAGKGDITFSKSPANPTLPGSTNHAIPYTVV